MQGENKIRVREIFKSMVDNVCVVGGDELTMEVCNGFYKHGDIEIMLIMHGIYI